MRHGARAHGPDRLRRRAAALLFVACAWGAGAAEDISGKSAELKALRSRIEALQSKGVDRKRALDTTAAEERQARRKSAAASTRLHTIESQMQSRLDRLAALTAERDRHAADIAERKRVLARMLRSVYMRGRHEDLRLALGQDDPSAARRALVYAGYQSRARNAAIESAGERLRAAEALAAEIQVQADRFAELRDEAERELRLLEREREAKSAQAASIRRDIARDEKRLRALRADEVRLNKLLADLERRSKARTGNSVARAGRGDGSGPFRKLQGKLGWPVQGRIARAFGTRHGEGLRAQGTTLRAPAASEVVAIADGEVVFADRFGPLGLLVIIDHGAGYMSLYGENARLQRRAGAAVKAGEAIATTGTGPEGESELYFEIRKDGKPVDPSRWCVATAKD
ncbi:MAG: murein hydrolase activator EnvC [Gammaproteobacteria bacterium]